MKNLIRKPWFIAIAAVVVVGAAFLGYRAYRARSGATAASALQTVEARIGTLTAQIGATGSVRANQSATLSFQTSGTVGNVAVQPGSQVAKGDVLAALAATSLSPQVLLAQADLVSAQNALDELLLSKTAQATAQLNLANAQKALSDAQYKRTVQQKGNRASADIIDGTEANLVLANEEVDHLQLMYNAASGAAARAAALSNLTAARRKRDSLQANLNWYLGKPSPADQAILDATVAQAQAAVDDAQRAYDRVKDGPNPDDVAAARARVASAQATLDESRITAPFAGTVTLVNVHPGDQATPGAAAVGLADLSKYQVDVQVSEVDIDKVKVGQPAALTFDAILNKTYHGKVTEISMTGTVTSGVVNFVVTVEISDADASIRPGMTTAVNVTVTQLNNVLLVPSRAVRTQSNQRVVFVLRNGVATPVRVRLGASSDTLSQILSGDVKAGDLIVLNPPTTTGGGAIFGGGGGGFGGGGGGGFGGGGFRAGD